MMSDYSELKAAIADVYAAAKSDTSGPLVVGELNIALSRYEKVATVEVVDQILAVLEEKDQALELEREKSRRVMSENHQQTLRIAELERDKLTLNSIINTGANRTDLAEQELKVEREQSAYYETQMWYFHGLAESESERCQRQTIADGNEILALEARNKELEQRLQQPIPETLVDSVCHTAAEIYHANNEDKAQEIINRIRKALTAGKVEGE